VRQRTEAWLAWWYRHGIVGPTALNNVVTELFRGPLTLGWDPAVLSGALPDTGIRMCEVRLICIMGLCSILVYRAAAGVKSRISHLVCTETSNPARHHGQHVRSCQSISNQRDHCSHSSMPSDNRPHHSRDIHSGWETETTLWEDMEAPSWPSRGPNIRQPSSTSQGTR